MDLLEDIERLYWIMKGAMQASEAVRLYGLKNGMFMNYGLNAKSLVEYKFVSNQTFFKEFPK